MHLRDDLQETVALLPNLPPRLAEVAADLPPNFIPMIRAMPDWLIDVVSNAALRSDRRILGAILRQHVMPVEDRTLERWPLPWQLVNGKATTPTLAGVALAYSKVKAAPVIMGGRHLTRSADAAAAAEQHAA